MSGYAKLFSSILHSTIWLEENHVRLVWITMLAMADKKGRVEASVPGLSVAARVSLDECTEALDKFMSPDLHSRTKEHEGRRICEVDGGWLLLNYEKHRESQSQESSRENRNARQRRWRERKAVSEKDASTCRRHVDAMRADVDAKRLHVDAKSANVDGDVDAVDANVDAKRLHVDAKAANVDGSSVTSSTLVDASASASASVCSDQGVQGDSVRLDSAGRPIPRKPIFPERIQAHHYEPAPAMVEWAAGRGLSADDLRTMRLELDDKLGHDTHTLSFWDEKWLRFVEVAVKSKSRRKAPADESYELPPGIEVCL